MSAYIADIFGRSPVTPLKRHVDCACRCVRELQPVLDAALAEDWAAARKAADTVVELEQEADRRKTEIRLHLSRRLWMPVPRTDLQALLIEQDTMANRTRDVATLVVGRKMHVPVNIADKMAGFVGHCVNTARQARKCVHELDNMFVADPDSALHSRIASMIDEIEHMEAETDGLQVELRAGLHALESELEPVNIAFLYRVIELTGEIADAANRVGHRLQVVLSH
ncbi:MAG: TIGR00153 family protein [Woeseia sp.]